MDQATQSTPNPAISEWARLINDQISLAQVQGKLTIPSGCSVERMLVTKIYGEDLPRSEKLVREDEVRSWLKGLDVPRGDVTHSRLMDAIALTAERCSFGPIAKHCEKIKQAYDEALQQMYDASGALPRHSRQSDEIIVDDDGDIEKEGGTNSHDGGIRFMPPRVYKGIQPYEKLGRKEKLEIMETIRNDPSNLYKHSGEYLRCYRNTKYKSNHLSQEEAADKIGCNVATLKRLELGEGLPSPKFLEKMKVHFFETDAANYNDYEECVIRNRISKASGHTKEGDLLSASSEFWQLPKVFWAAVMDHRLHPEWNRRINNPSWADTVPHIRSDGEYLWAIRHYFGLTIEQVAQATGKSYSCVEDVEAGDKGFPFVRDALAEFYIARQKTQQTDEQRLGVKPSERTPDLISNEIMAKLRDIRVTESARHKGHAAKTQKLAFVPRDRKASAGKKDEGSFRE